MNSVHLRARAAVFFALFTAAAWLALLSCSSDPTNTLGSDSDLLGSEPGTVSQQPIDVFADTVYAFNTPIAVDTDLEVGDDSLYTHTIILQPGFGDLNSGDQNRTVRHAALHLFTGNVEGSFPVRFYKLGHTYNEGDTISLGSLPDSTLILDPDSLTVERRLEKAKPLYGIPASLAQDWIRKPETRQAIAIVYTDHSNRRIATVPAREVTDGHPYLQVEYTDNSTGTYNIIDDATLYTPRFSTPNLIVSDGYARRVFLKVATDSLAKDSAVHTARLRLHVVPESLIGTALTDDTPPVRVDGIRLILYIPDSPDPANPAFKTGQRIIEVLLRAEQDTVQFSMTNAIFLVLQGSLKNNGFAIRVRDENTELRQVEFYGTGAPDSLRPTCSVTTSTPADFH